MSNLLEVRAEPESWFAAMPKRASLENLESKSIFVAGRSQFSGWRKRVKELGDERVLEFLDRVAVISDVHPKPDFIFIDGQGSDVTLDDFADDSEFLELFRHRTQSPFLGDENPDGAFKRIFQPALSNALEWQLIDRFLLEQLLNRRNAEHNFLLNQMEGLPDTVEIHSELPSTGRGENKRVMTSQEVRQGLKSFLDVARGFNKQISFCIYRRRSAAFPHPRLQRMRFSRGDLITSLDNGLASISRRTESVVFSRVASEDWTRVFSSLTKLAVEEFRTPGG